MLFSCLNFEVRATRIDETEEIVFDIIYFVKNDYTESASPKKHSAFWTAFIETEIDSFL